MKFNTVTFCSAKKACTNGQGINKVYPTVQSRHLHNDMKHYRYASRAHENSMQM